METNWEVVVYPLIGNLLIITRAAALQLFIEMELKCDALIELRDHNQTLTCMYCKQRATLN